MNIGPVWYFARSEFSGRAWHETTLSYSIVLGRGLNSVN